jgi:phosphatidylethanolamine-binding protein (PEBP) family uncharacterized protein
MPPPLLPQQPRAPSRNKTRRRPRGRPRKLRGGVQPPLAITFPGDVAAASTLPLLPREAVAANPTAKWPAGAPAAPLKTLIAWDPDAPRAPYLHWLVANCRGTDPSSGTTLVPWAPPTPPSGTHRYLFGLYEQTRGPITPHLQPPRTPFSPAALVKAHGLKLVATTGFKVAAPQSL